jgi:GntR family histidine utilization transcriptional repressor
VPSESALGQQFGVARMTVNRALRELAAEGMVTRVQGSGTRVAELHRISSRLTIRDIHEEVAERGHVHTTRVVLVAQEKAAPTWQQSLGLRTARGVPHGADPPGKRRAHPVRRPLRQPGGRARLPEVDFTQTTPTHHLLAHAPLTEASYSIEACLPTVPEAKPAGHPAQ